MTFIPDDQVETILATIWAIVWIYMGYQLYLEYKRMSGMGVLFVLPRLFLLSSLSFFVHMVFNISTFFAATAFVFWMNVVFEWIAWSLLYFVIFEIAQGWGIVDTEMKLWVAPVLAIVLYLVATIADSSAYFMEMFQSKKNPLRYVDIMTAFFLPVMGLLFSYCLHVVRQAQMTPEKTTWYDRFNLLMLLKLWSPLAILLLGEIRRPILSFYLLALNTSVYYFFFVSLQQGTRENIFIHFSNENAPKKYKIKGA